MADLWVLSPDEIEFVKKAKSAWFSKEDTISSIQKKRWWTSTELSQETPQQQHTTPDNFFDFQKSQSQESPWLRSYLNIITPTIAGAGAMSLLSPAKRQFASPWPLLEEWRISSVGQEANVESLSNRLTQNPKVEKNLLMSEAWKIIWEKAAPNTKTYKDLLTQLPKITSDYYKQSGLKDTLEKIDIGWKHGRIDQLLSAMKEELTKPWGWVKLGQEKLATTIEWLLNKNNVGKLSLWDATYIKSHINDFLKWRTPTGNEKSWLTAEGIQSVYHEIKNEIETRASEAWYKDVKKVNKGYQSLLEAEPAINKVANQVQQQTVRQIPKTTWQTITKWIWSLAGELINFSTAWGLKNIMGSALKWAWVNPNQIYDIQEIEKQLPNILKKLKKAWANPKYITAITEAVWKAAWWVTKEATPLAKTVSVGTQLWKVWGNVLKSVSKWLLTLDPINTPELLKYIPWTIWKSFKEYLKTSPVWVTQSAIAQKYDLQNEYKNLFWTLPNNSKEGIKKAQDAIRNWKVQPADMSPELYELIWWA